MSGLNLSSIDLAISSKPQIASVLKDLLLSNRFLIQIGSGQLEVADTGNSDGDTTDTSIEDDGQGWTVNQWRGMRCSIAGKGSAVISSNDADTLTLIAPGITGAAGGGDNFDIIADVNPTLGNNFQIEWNDSSNQIILHNDYPIYDTGGNYLFMNTADPTTDQVVPIATLNQDPSPYNHFFLVNGVPGSHTGTLERVASSGQAEPTPVGVKVIYIGWVYRGTANQIIVKNIGRTIDISPLSKAVSFIDYLDENTKIKVTLYDTNILRFTAFFGPGVTKTIREVGMVITDEVSFPHMFAYSRVPDQALTDTENLRVLWEITI